MRASPHATTVTKKTANNACNPNQAFVVQFRTRPRGAPSWEGRVEHLVSSQVARFHSLDELLTFMTRVLTEVEAQEGVA